MRQTQRGPAAKRKHCTTGSEMCQRQEAIKDIHIHRPLSTTYGWKQMTRWTRSVQAGLEQVIAGHGFNTPNVSEEQFVLRLIMCREYNISVPMPVHSPSTGECGLFPKRETNEEVHCYRHNFTKVTNFHVCGFVLVGLKIISMTTFSDRQHSSTTSSLKCDHCHWQPHGGQE